MTTTIHFRLLTLGAALSSLLLPLQAARADPQSCPGVIASSVGPEGCIFDGTGSVTINSVATITNTSTATYNGHGPAAGLIIGAGITQWINNGTLTGTQRGLQISQGANLTDGLVNNGTITGTGHGIELQLGSTIGHGNGQYAIYNTGSITGTDTSFGDASGIRIADSSTIDGDIYNSGTIQGGYRGLNLDDSTLNGSLYNSGTISGGSYGVYNSGAINGAIYNQAGGSISGGTYSIYSTGGALTGVSNAGVLRGSMYIVNTNSSALDISGSSSGNAGVLTGYGDTVTDAATNTGNNASASKGQIYTNGDIVFAGGKLILNDDLYFSNYNNSITDLSNSATLQSGTLQINQPLVVAGNYYQTGGTLQIGAVNADVAGRAGYGQLVVSGNTSMTGGTVNIVSAGYALAPGQAYTVVKTTGTATYSGLSYTAQGFAATGAQVSNDLVVTLGAATSGSSSSSTSFTNATVHNAIDSLGGLNNAPGGTDTALGILRNEMLGATYGAQTSTINQIGKQLSPAVTGAAPTVSTDNALNVLAQHLNGLRIAQGSGGSGSGIATGDAPGQWTAWGQVYGGHASQQGSGAIDGYSANYGGIMLGADRAVGERWRAGAAFNYSAIGISNTGDTSGNWARVNSYGLLGYASYDGRPWYLNLSAGVAQQSYQETRTFAGIPGALGSAQGNFSGQQYMARAEAGYPLDLGWATLTPIASLQYGYVHQNAYAENGTGALSVGASHNSSAQSRLGAKLARSFQSRYGAVTPSVQLQWTHEYVRAGQQVQALYIGDATGQTAFTTVGASPIRDMAGLSLSVTLAHSNTLSLSARYEVQAASGYLAQAAMLRLQKRF